MKPYTWQFECNGLSIHISCTQQLLTLKQHFVISINDEIKKIISMSIFYTFIRMVVPYRGSELEVLIAPKNGFKNKFLKSGAQIYLDGKFLAGELSRDLALPNLGLYQRKFDMGIMKYLLIEGMCKNGITIGIGVMIASFINGRYREPSVLQMMATDILVFMFVSGSIVGLFNWLSIKQTLKVRR